MAAHFAMSAHMPGISQYEIPMGIANQLGWVVQIIYLILIFLEIFSTFVANIYGITLRVQRRTSLSPRVITLGIMVFCYFFSQFGFSSLLSLSTRCSGTVSALGAPTDFVRNPQFREIKGLSQR